MTRVLSIFRKKGDEKICVLPDIGTISIMKHGPESKPTFRAALEIPNNLIEKKETRIMIYECLSRNGYYTKAEVNEITTGSFEIFPRDAI